MNSYAVASDYPENNKEKDFLTQNFGLGWLSDFNKLPHIWVASSKTPMEEFIFQKGCRPQSCNFTEDWVPFRKFFKNVSSIIGRPKSSKTENLIAMTSCWDHGYYNDVGYTLHIFYKKKFYNKMSLKNQKP